MKTVIIHLKGNSGSIRFNALDAGTKEDGVPFFTLPPEAKFSIPILSVDSIAALIISDADEEVTPVLGS